MDFISLCSIEVWKPIPLWYNSWSVQHYKHTYSQLIHGFWRLFQCYITVIVVLFVGTPVAVKRFTQKWRCSVNLLCLRRHAHGPLSGGLAKRDYSSSGHLRCRWLYLFSTTASIIFDLKPWSLVSHKIQVSNCPGLRIKKHKMNTHGSWPYMRSYEAKQSVCARNWTLLPLPVTQSLRHSSWLILLNIFILFQVKISKRS